MATIFFLMEWTAGANPQEVSKAVIQCRMFSGRYRTFLRSSNQSESCNASCLSPSCASSAESLENLIIHCPAYSTTLEGLLSRGGSYLRNVYFLKSYPSLCIHVSETVILVSQQKPTNIDKYASRLVYFKTRSRTFFIH